MLATWDVTERSTAFERVGCSAEPERRGPNPAVAVELCSLHYCFHWDRGRMLGTKHYLRCLPAWCFQVSRESTQRQEPRRWRVAATGSCLFPGTAEIMKWNIEDHGFAMAI